MQAKLVARETELTCIDTLPVLCRGQPDGGESCNNLYSCDHSDVLQVPCHPATKFCTHPTVASFAVFLACSTKFARTANDEHWQQGYGSVFSSTNVSSVDLLLILYAGI